MKISASTCTVILTGLAPNTKTRNPLLLLSQLFVLHSEGIWTLFGSPALKLCTVLPPQSHKHTRPQRTTRVSDTADWTITKRTSTHSTDLIIKKRTEIIKIQKNPEACWANWLWGRNGSEIEKQQKSGNVESRNKAAAVSEREDRGRGGFGRVIDRWWEVLFTW